MLSSHLLNVAGINAYESFTTPELAVCVISRVVLTGHTKQEGSGPLMVEVQYSDHAFAWRAHNSLSGSLLGANDIARGQADGWKKTITGFGGKPEDSKKVSQSNLEEGRRANLLTILFGGG